MENTGVYAIDAVVGEVIGEDVITTASNTNSYKMDVRGMKQVRWPGLNHARLGGVFTDENNRVLSTFIMSVSHTYLTSTSVIMCSVTYLTDKMDLFTSFRDIGDIECPLVVDSSIEP